jgi:FXSXX-COOH protein
MTEEVEERGAPLVDLTGIDLETLTELPETVLIAALRDIRSGAGEDRYCAFESALP